MFQRGKSSARDRFRARLGLEVLEDRLALAAGLAAQAAALAPASEQVTIAAVPNDARFGDQWALQNASNPAADINAPRAWDVTTGSTKMIVSVMDTGIDYRHPDLYQNIWINPNEIPLSRRANLIDADGDGLVTFRDLNDTRNKGAGKIVDLDGDGRITGADLLKPMVKDASGKDTGKGGWADGKDGGDGYVDDIIGWNFVDNNNNPMDTQGHGTHVAGTIGAAGNNGIGVAGIDWKVQMMPIRFMDGDGKGTVSQFILGLQYAVAHGAKISNNSWVGAGVSDDLTKAIDAARLKGHILVCAAGNQGTNNDTNPNFPASYSQDNVLSVTAIDRNGNLASFSNYGKTTVDLAAPGGDILSAAIGGGYKYNSGTSMATPHVTGVVALVWSLHPTWTYSQVVTQVLNTADRTAALTGKIKAGLVNAAAAVGAAQASATAPIIINAVNLGTATSLGPTIRVTFDRPMNATTFSTVDVVLTGPDGKPVALSAVKAVAGYSNQVFDIVLGAAQTKSGSYTLVVGPTIKDNAGYQMTAFRKVFTVSAPALPPKVINAGILGNSTTSMGTIRVTFDRAMNPATFTPADVVLTGPNGMVIAVSAVKSVAGYGDRVFDIVLGAVQTKGGNYTLKFGPAVNDTFGLAMSAAFQKVLTLSTPVSAPVIINTANQGTAASLGATIRITFDRVMNVSTFTTGDVVLTGPGGKVVAVSAVKSVAGYSDKVFDIVLSAAQTAPGTYTLKIGPAVSDTFGVSMATAFQKVFSLTTPVSAPVIINAVNLGTATSLGATIRVTFDRVMNVSTFTAADVVLTGPDGKAIAVSAVKSVAGYGDKVFDIVLAAAQTKAGTYTLKVGPGVSNTFGVSMATAFTKAFTVAATAIPPTIVNTVNLGNSTTSMGTIRVTFSRVMNVSTFTTGDVVLTGPDGKAIAVSAVKSVAGYGDKVFDIVLATIQTKAGNYTLKVGPAVSDTFGTPMSVAYQRVFTLAGLPAPAPSALTYTSTVAVSVPKGSRGVGILTVADGFVIGDLNVKVNITHPEVMDLYIHLQAPDGTDILLSNQKGGYSANFVNTVFDDQASTPVGYGFGPYTGSYRPDAPLSALNGKNVNGTWKLWVEDRKGTASGTILNWSIIVKPKATM